jgi:hypothetical protein
MFREDSAGPCSYPIRALGFSWQCVPRRQDRAGFILPRRCEFPSAQRPNAIPQTRDRFEVKLDSYPHPAAHSLA